MNINVNDPQFLVAVLKDEVVNRTRYLVDQGIAYDSKWRDSFVELFQVIAELEAQLCTCEELTELGEDNLQTEMQEHAAEEARRVQAYQQAEMAEAERLESETRFAYPLGTTGTMGKGKTVWTIKGHRNGDILVSRDGKGKNEMYIKPESLKVISNKN